MKKCDFLEDSEPLNVAGDGGKRGQKESRKGGRCRAVGDFASPMLTVTPNSKLVYQVLLYVVVGR